MHCMIVPTRPHLVGCRVYIATLDERDNQVTAGETAYQCLITPSQAQQARLLVHCTPMTAVIPVT